MHEISIANSIVEVATAHAVEANAEKVVSITLRIGALSCVHRSALEFSFEIVTEGTILEGAELKIIEVPVTIYCGNCDHDFELASIQSFCCPVCGTLSGDVRQGKELDIDAIEIVEYLRDVKP